MTDVNSFPHLKSSGIWGLLSWPVLDCKFPPCRTCLGFQGRWKTTYDSLSLSHFLKVLLHYTSLGGHPFYGNRRSTSLLTSPPEGITTSPFHFFYDDVTGSFLHYRLLSPTLFPSSPTEFTQSWRVWMCRSTPVPDVKTDSYHKGIERSRMSQKNKYNRVNWKDLDTLLSSLQEYSKGKNIFYFDSNSLISCLCLSVREK